MCGIGRTVYFRVEIRVEVGHYISLQFLMNESKSVMSGGQDRESCFVFVPSYFSLCCVDCMHNEAVWVHPRQLVFAYGEEALLDVWKS